MRIRSIKSFFCFKGIINSLSAIEKKKKNYYFTIYSTRSREKYFEYSGVLNVLKKKNQRGCGKKIKQR